MRFSVRAAFCLAIPAWTSSLVGAQDPSSTACGTVFNSTKAYFIPAHEVWDCLLSTPFNGTLASELVAYWSDTFQFQSTLAYLKDPPPGYQQPGVDLLAGLDLIQDQIHNGVFSNQYSFEAAVHSLLQRTHDFHIGLTGGVMSAFAFTPNLYLASVSLDGISLPKVYDANELATWYKYKTATFPSAITKIHGQPAGKFLAKYAARNSYGAIEPHADFNHIMFSFAAAIQGYTDDFSTPFFSGDILPIEFENGTTVNFDWMAVYIGGSDAPYIETGQDLYDWFLLGELTQTEIRINGDPTTQAADPATTVAQEATATATPTPYTGWGGAYPNVADVIQPNLGYGGSVTGYFLNDTKVGVLSIPSFNVPDDTTYVQSFLDTIKAFLAKSKEAGMEKILVDLQSNYGGEQLLARETFGHFFPNIAGFSGMRSRSFDMADQLGNTMTNYFAQHNATLNDTLYATFLNDPWAVTNEINADTQQNFTSWPEYYGPHADRDDGFSTVFQYNYTSPDIVWVASGIDITEDELPTTPPYDARDIVILTDSICASTCDLFVELMHHEAGVRTVVAGGLPQEGPMQARGADRGAQLLRSYQVDANLAYAASINSSVSHFLLDRHQSKAQIATLSFNFADQVRVKEYVPLQFAYEAADCRIFYTPDTFFDYTSLWQYAASAIFANASTCVARSAEHNNTMQTDIYGPSAEQRASWEATNPANVKHNDSVNLGLVSDQIAFWIGWNEDCCKISPMIGGSKLPAPAVAPSSQHPVPNTQQRQSWQQSSSGPAGPPPGLASYYSVQPVQGGSAPYQAPLYNSGPSFSSSGYQQSSKYQPAADTGLAGRAAPEGRDLTFARGRSRMRSVWSTA